MHLCFGTPGNLGGFQELYVMFSLWALSASKLGGSARNGPKGSPEEWSCWSSPWHDDAPSKGALALHEGGMGLTEHRRNKRLWKIHPSTASLHPWSAVSA